jgi:Tat protein translocase TatC
VQLPKRLEHGEEVSLIEHLTELRQRLMVAFIALGVGFAVAFWRNSDILRLFNRQLPIDPHTHRHILPTTLSVSEPFTNSMIISAYAGLLLALPIVFYQLYAFVIPAFSSKTSKHIWPIMIIVPLLFVGGVAFGYEVVLPRAIHFLLGFNASQYNVQVRANSYYSFACMILAAMGLIFEMPAAVAALTRVGILSARLMRKNRRYAIVVLAAIAALLPGVDPVSMLLEFLPLLFVGGVAFGYEVVLPRAIHFLLGFNASQYNVQVRANSYYSFACMILAAMGLIFEMPAAVAALTRVGILSAALMRKHRRYAIVVLAAIAALLPGVDPVSMLLEFLPLLVLYEVSIWVARLVEIRRDRVTEEEPVPGAS